MPAAMAGNTSPNTAADGAYAGAVWVGLDAARGQCHGGGASNVKTTGTVAAASARPDGDSATGSPSARRSRHRGRRLLLRRDRPAASTPTSTLRQSIGQRHHPGGHGDQGVTNAAVEQNATTNGASTSTRRPRGLREGITTTTRTPSVTAVKGANNSLSPSTPRPRRRVMSRTARPSTGTGRQHAHESARYARLRQAGTYTITLTVEDRRPAPNRDGDVRATNVAGARSTAAARLSTLACRRPR
jgi:hypothetical protein